MYFYTVNTYPINAVNKFTKQKSLEQNSDKASPLMVQIISWFF